MLSRIFAIVKSTLEPGKGRIILKKIVRRITYRPDKLALQENVEWIKTNCKDFGDQAARLDPDLWREAQESSQKLKERGTRTLAEAGVKMGGGGFYPMLYFLVRFRRPRTIVETGVAAGYSSQVFLDALDRNGGGELWSSDFPYFRIQDPEKFIGILVEERLKSRWHLLIDGDEVNLPIIARSVTDIDIFHYDSDKTTSGRVFAFEQLMPKMAKHGLIVMDDIQDDTFFRQKVRENDVSSFAIYEFEGKYIGMYEMP